MNKFRFLGAVFYCFALLLATYTSAQASLVTFTEVSRIDRSAGGWGIGFLDGRLFNSDGPSLSELNPDTGAVINSGPWLTDGHHVVGLAGNSDDGLLYAEIIGTPQIQIINPDTLAIVGSVSNVGKNYQGLAAFEGKLYATDNSNFYIDELDILTGSVIRSHNISDVVYAAFDGAGGTSITGIEVFDNNIFVNITRIIGRATELHQFGLTDFSHVGVSYYFDGSMGDEFVDNESMASAYDGEFLWLSAVNETQLVKLTPSPVPIPASVWLFGSGLMGLIGIARRKKAA